MDCRVKSGNDRMFSGEAHYIAVPPRDEVFVADTLNYHVQKYVGAESYPLKAILTEGCRAY